MVAAVRSIPVIGNGDVTTPEAARQMLAETGCAGVSIGRGAFYNPWIFHQTEHLLTSGERLPEPGFEERVRVMRRHLDLMVEVFGEPHGCRQFRKVAPWYARRFGPAAEFKRGVVMLSSRAEFEEILAAYRTWRAQFADAHGELLPRFQPAPLATTLGAAADVEGKAVAVPRGPVERW